MRGRIHDELGRHLVAVSNVILPNGEVLNWPIPNLFMGRIPPSKVMKSAIMLRCLLSTSMP